MFFSFLEILVLELPDAVLVENKIISVCNASKKRGGKNWSRLGFDRRISEFNRVFFVGRTPLFISSSQPETHV